MEKIEIETIEVHNVWTLYGMNRDGTESKDKLAQFSRPQDWGDPRWVYHRFTLTWEVDGTRYVNHAHCWTDLQRPKFQYPQLFASLFAQISIPGEPPEFCGNKFLHEDDFWQDKWGPQPPVFEVEARRVLSSDDDFGWTDDDTPDDVRTLGTDPEPEQTCRVCGCTHYHPCEGGCYWVEDDLCSACAETTEDLIEFGPCCHCGATGPTVRNLIMLSVKARTPGPGSWGCFQCGLPMEGASAVLCDACIDAGLHPIFAIDGEPAKGVRVPIGELVEPFEHDLSKHPEVIGFDAER